MGEDVKINLETTSVAETEEVGIRLACALSGGMLVTLSGELGAGKTVFVRGVACGLNIPAGIVVTSPTYVLLHTYRGGRLTLHHIDVYRMVGSAGEFDASGLTECLYDNEAIVCLEWPERLPDFKWPDDRIEVVIEHREPQRRTIKITGSGPRAELAVKTLISRK